MKAVGCGRNRLAFALGCGRLDVRSDRRPWMLWMEVGLVIRQYVKKANMKSVYMRRMNSVTVPTIYHLATRPVQPRINVASPHITEKAPRIPPDPLSADGIVPL